MKFENMSGKRTRSFKCAVHHRDREVCSENDFHLILEEPPLFQRMLQVIALELLPDKRDRKYYADRYTCCPPPWFIVFITVIEIAGNVECGIEHKLGEEVFHSNWIKFLGERQCRVGGLSTISSFELPPPAISNQNCHEKVVLTFVLTSAITALPVGKIMNLSL
uniref:Rhomboid-like protein n=1 Tax=Glossina austeni TaxID=7395 RepID=A0A1A9V405_GLOAU